MIVIVLIGVALFIACALPFVKCCSLGLHRWGPWVRFEVQHTSNPNVPVKQSWKHTCVAHRKFCVGCGKNSKLRHLSKKCCVIKVIY